MPIWRASVLLRLTPEAGTARFVAALALAVTSGCNQLTGAADIDILESEQQGSGGTQSLGNGGTSSGNGSTFGNGGFFGLGGNLGLGGDLGLGGNFGLGGVYGNGGAVSNGGSTGNQVCQPNSVRACAAVGCTTGQQSCNLDGLGYGSCICTDTCAADGAPCTVNADCCGSTTGSALCAANVCQPACDDDADCAATCCLSWYDTSTNAFIGDACGDASTCLDLLGATPHGARCGGDWQCDSNQCDPDFGVCFYEDCISSAECAPFATCFSVDGVSSACFPACATDPTCGNTGLFCNDIVNAEGMLDRACLPLLLP